MVEFNCMQTVFVLNFGEQHPDIFYIKNCFLISCKAHIIVLLNIIEKVLVRLKVNILTSLVFCTYLYEYHIVWFYHTIAKHKITPQTCLVLSLHGQPKSLVAPHNNHSTLCTRWWAVLLLKKKKSVFHKFRP